MLLGEPKPEISIVVENYLQAIYKLIERGDRVFPTRLAESMNVSVATTVATLRRLTKQGLVAVNSGKEISLTSKGSEMAESVVRRHRLSERMLIEMLGVEWHRAHREAHRFEHAISPNVEAKMASALGYPKTNPYGQPIPGYNSDSPSRSLTLLSMIPEGGEATVERVPEEDMLLLQFFESSGLKPGATVKVKELAPFKGTITLLLNGDEVVLGTDIAAKVAVNTPSC